jgi:hypothetical protein
MVIIYCKRLSLVAGLVVVALIHIGKATTSLASWFYR